MSPWLAAAYCALALGLGWLLAGGRRWRTKAVYVVCAPAVALALWLGRPDPTGWPSRAAVPTHAQLVSALVDEPDPTTGDPGRIYLWLDLGAAAPRAFSLPYSRPLHEQVQRALDAVRHGTPVGVAHASAAGARHGRAGQRVRAPLRFYPRPPVQLPPKVDAASPLNGGRGATRSTGR
jgi:hypothetical protein